MVNKNRVVMIVGIAIIILTFLFLWLYFLIGDCIVNWASGGLKVDWPLIKDCTY